MQTAALKVRNNPVLRRSVSQMKPKRTVWGFLGVILFFFIPEIIAFGWGASITVYAKTELLQYPHGFYAIWNEALIMLFEDGGSWVNLGIGFAFLIWLFF